MIYRWDHFELRAGERRLFGPEGEVPLEPRQFELLLKLVRNHGQAVSRDELLDAVWPGRVVVDETVTQAARRLRRALGASSDYPIQAVRGYGYRFDADVVTVSKQREPRAERRLWWLAGAGAACVLAALVASLSFLPGTSVRADPQRVAILGFQAPDEAQAWVERGLSSLVAESLPARHHIDVVPAQTGFALADAADGSVADSARRVRAGTGADYVLGASVQRSGSRWRLRYSLRRGDEPVWDDVVEGTDLRSLVEALSTALADHLDAPRRKRLAPSPLSRIDFVNQAFARGRQARYEGNFKQAAELFRLCLEHDPGMLVARYELADALRRLGRYDQARTEAEAVRAAAQSRGDRALAADALTTLGLIAWRQGDYETGAAHVQQALETHEAEGRRAAAAYDRNILGVILGRRGEGRAASEHYLKALAAYRALGDRAGEAKTLNNLGWHAFNLGDYRTAADYDTRALAIQQELGLTSGAALSLNALGSAHLNMGRFSDAEAHYEQALEMRQRIGDRAGVVTTLGNLGVIAAARGQNQRAERRVRDSLELAIELGNPELQAHAEVKLGDILTRAGRFGEAGAAFDRAEQLWDEVGIGRARKELALWRTQIALASGNVAAARQRLASVVEIEDMALSAWAGWLRGRMHRLANENEPALRELNRAIDFARRAGDPRTRVDAGIDAAHLCMDMELDCAADHVRDVAAWQDEYAPAVVVQGRWLLEQGDAELAVAELERARRLAGDNWDDQQQRWLVQAREAAGISDVGLQASR